MQIKYRGAAVQISAVLSSRDVTGPGQKRLSQIRPHNPMRSALRKRLDWCVQWRSVCSDAWQSAVPPVARHSPVHSAAEGQSSWPPPPAARGPRCSRTTSDSVSSGWTSLVQAAPGRRPTPAGTSRCPGTWAWGSSWQGARCRGPSVPHSHERSGNAVCCSIWLCSARLRLWCGCSALCWGSAGGPLVWRSPQAKVTDEAAVADAELPHGRAVDD